MSAQRLQIDLPERMPFHFPLTIRVTDTNHGGHMGNERVLMYCQEARAGLLAAIGASEADIDGTGIIIADAAIRFMAEGFAGDVLTIAVGVGNFQRRSCDFYYRLVRDHDQREIARARTRIVFFDYVRREVAEIPPGFAQRVEALGPPHV